MNPDILSFLLKKSRQTNPHQVPQRGPYGDRYLLTGPFTSLLIYLLYLSFRVPGKEAPSMFRNRVPMARDTPSQEPLFYSFIHSRMSAGVPKKEPSYIWGKTRSPSTEPHADGRPTYNGVRPGSPRGSLRHCYLYPSAMQPSARYLPPWLG